MISLALYDTQGTQQAQLVGNADGGYTSLAYRRILNGVGLAQFTIVGDNPLIPLLEMGWILRIHRKIEDEWKEEFCGILDNFDWEYKAQPKVKVSFSSLESVFASRIIAYPADTQDRNNFQGVRAETLMKSLVKYNSTTWGTVADGRIRDAASGYPYNLITIEDDLERGELLHWYCAWQNLLEQLQEIGDDFRLVWVDSTTWEFCYGGVGQDQSNQVVFSLDRHNLIEPRYYLSERDSRTVAIVAGKFQEIDREVEAVLADSYSPDYDKEVFIDARDIEEGDFSGLINRGSLRIEDYKREEVFSFHVAQVPNARYRIEYDLGDWVTVQNPLTLEKYKLRISGITVSEDEGGKETIDIEVTNV